MKEPKSSSSLNQSTYNGSLKFRRREVDSQAQLVNHRRSVDILYGCDNKEKTCDKDGTLDPKTLGDHEYLSHCLRPLIRSQWNRGHNTSDHMSRKEANSCDVKFIDFGFIDFPSEITERFDEQFLFYCKLSKTLETRQKMILLLSRLHPVSKFKDARQYPR